MNLCSTAASEDSSRKLLVAFVFVLVVVVGAYEFSRLVPVGVGVESGFGTLVLKLGIGGVILWFIISIAIIVSAWKGVKKLRGSHRFPVAFSIFLYATVLLMSMTFTSMVAYEDFVINTYFGLMLGILFRLSTLPLSSQFANAPAPAPGTRLRAG